MCRLYMCDCECSGIGGVAVAAASQVCVCAVVVRHVHMCIRCIYTGAQHCETIACALVAENYSNKIYSINILTIKLIMQWSLNNF